MMIRFISLLLALTVLMTVGARAQGSSDAVFTVPEVSVYAEAETAADAQRQAQAQGRRRAMDLLLRRLTAEEDWVYLPTLATGQPARAAGTPSPSASTPNFPDPNSNVFDPTTTGSIDAEFFSQPAKRAVALEASDIAALEEGFSIFGERTSARTYRARITYRFQPSEVRRLLEAANLPYSESQARRTLVLPVLETAEGLYLWETKNPWARAWLDRPLVNELTPLLLPLGDRQDVDGASVQEVQRFALDALAPLAQRYGTPQVIIAHGRLVEENNEFQFRVRLIDAFVDGRSSSRQRIDANNVAGLYDDANGFGADAVVSRSSSSGAPGRVLTDAFFRGQSDDFPALAQRAVETTVARYARDWKQQTLVDHSSVRVFNLVAWFASLDDWADIRLALEETPLVRDMKVGAFNNENAVLELTVTGEQEQFILAMSQENLTVWQGPNGGWNIADFNRARDIQSQIDQVSNLPSLTPRGQPVLEEQLEEATIGVPLGLPRVGVPGSVDEMLLEETVDGLGEAPVSLEPAFDPNVPISLEPADQPSSSLDAATENDSDER